MLLDVSRLVWRAWAGQLPTGIDRTCLAYVAHYHDRALAVLQRGGVTRILSQDLSRTLFDILLDQGKADVRKRLSRLGTRSAASLLVGQAASRAFAGRIYLNVGHTGLNRPGHIAWLGKTGVRPFYFIHDLIPLTHPEYCREDEPRKHLHRITTLLRYGRGIISNSRHTLDELIGFAVHQMVDALPSALVAPLGVDLASTEAREAPISDRPYFVMLGTIEARKNHLLILTIWAELARRLGPACPQLVIIGRRGWECEQAVDMLERSGTLRGHVIELPNCDDVMLDAYIRSARALLFPSFAEGYGLPLVEALARGTPVIASDLAVFRELAGEVPDYLSPIDGLGWAHCIESYARGDGPARAAQLDRLIGWRQPSWTRHFELVDDWLVQCETATPREP